MIRAKKVAKPRSNGHGLQLSVNGVGHSTLKQSASLPVLNSASASRKRVASINRRGQPSKSKLALSAAPATDRQQQKQQLQNGLRKNSNSNLPSVNRKSNSSNVVNKGGQLDKKVGFLSTLKVTNDKQVVNPPVKKKKAMNMKDALAQCEYAWDDENRMSVMRSQILIRYSHYNKTFEARNGIVRWSDIDEEYAISFVFKGDFKRHIRDERRNDFQAIEVKIGGNTSADYFMGLESIKESYILKIEEDEMAGIIGKVSKYVAPKNSASTSFIGKKKQTELLTDDLKKLTKEQLREKGEEMRNMLEARDLEEILYEK